MIPLLNYHININAITLNVCILQLFLEEGCLESTSDTIYLKIQESELFLDKTKHIYFHIIKNPI